MSEEQLKAFMEKVQGDTSLQEKLKAAADPDAVVTIAKDAGFVITAEEIRSELTDEEMESAAGGITSYEWCDTKCQYTGLRCCTQH
ncbi:nif11-like leader peptide domain protein [Synechococcus sp. BIOS-E4-1]|uniref:Nif11-like leader peptide family natural product precursor n=1 Tax=Synechococcus sp. BIOS-E4-1 TaxID=1400864 RepID=UPI0016483783|nr:Nif11-like leader peptide family natural product precursor [Synechococcus sp. BIOS-E4-1]QNI54661.1 nif11-like leader peptide domain protein [Synechococcus sp. BIOS-E4-1]